LPQFVVGELWKKSMKFLDVGARWNVVFLGMWANIGHILPLHHIRIEVGLILGRVLLRLWNIGLSWGFS
jgi:hypothetical protein